jgi:hypothetical protein
MALLYPLWASERIQQHYHELKRIPERYEGWVIKQLEKGGKTRRIIPPLDGDRFNRITSPRSAVMMRLYKKSRGPELVENDARSRAPHIRASTCSVSVPL